MISRIPAVIMAALLLVYLVLVAQLAVRFITVDGAVARTIGIALLVLPLVGLWALAVEVIFGARSERLGRRLAEEGRMPLDDLPRLPSGRVERAAAERAFPGFKTEVEAQPDAWESWYRLGLAYDACGDRRRARSAIRLAIALDRDARHNRR